MKHGFKALFVNMCNYRFFEKEVLPLGQLSLATLLTKNNICEAKVLDINYVYSHNILDKNDDIEVMLMQTADFILNEDADFISFYSMCNIHHYVIMAAAIIKKKSPQTVICIAGPHATITAKENLECFDFIDCVALGEGELTVESIILGARRKNFADSMGIAYRDQREIVVKKNNELFYNLDDLPFVDYSLLNFVPTGRMDIEVGRGCPFSCTFCTTNLFWEKKYRLKSPQRIFEEIQYAIKELGIHKFSFEHDLFLLNRDVVVEICDLIQKNKLDIIWGCSSRLDCIDRELIQTMARAGCREIYFGIESGSEKIQSAIKKNLDISKLETVISWLKEAGIDPTFSFIYGFPEESDEEIEKTLELMYKIYNMYYKNYFQSMVQVQLHKLVFMPGTSITAEQYGNLKRPQYYRTALQHGEECWENVEIMQLLNNKEIFTQYFELRNEFMESVEDMDVFYGFLFNYFIEYLDMTYKVLVYHFGKHLSLFRAFRETIGSEKMNSKFYSEKLTNGELIVWAIELFCYFINTNNFGKDQKLINDIFYFEYYIFLKKHNKKNEVLELEVDYDVLQMKKHRKLDFVPKKFLIRFEGDRIYQRCC